MQTRKVIFSLCLFLAIAGKAFAQEPAPAPQPAKPSLSNAAPGIPFKSEPQGFAEQSSSTLIITIVLLGATVAGLYYLRNHLQKKGGPSFLKPASVQLKERIRLSTHLTMYLVTYRNKEILIAHAGNSVTRISEVPIDAASGQQSQSPNNNSPD